MNQVTTKTNPFKKGIIIISIGIPLVVAVLLYTPISTGLKGPWISFLPTLNAILNSTTSILLVSALVAIKRKNIHLHKSLMLVSLLLGVFFLISYVLYHASTNSVLYGDINHDGILDASEKTLVGSMRSVYLLVLLTHIGFSIVVVPLVLASAYYSLTGDLVQHKRIVKFSYPIWLYVSITGVIVYLMISPYYI